MKIVITIHVFCYNFHHKIKFARDTIALHNFWQFINEFNPKRACWCNCWIFDYSAEYFIATSRGDNPTYRVEAQAVVDTVNDTVTCTILPGVGGTLDAGTYVYDVQIANGASLIFTLLTGTITVTEQVTGAA